MVYRETHLVWEEVKAGDIVFPTPGGRPFVAAVDAFPSTGPVGGLTVVRDEQHEDHLHLSTGQTCVLREFDPSIQEESGIPDEKPPWEL